MNDWRIKTVETHTTTCECCGKDILLVNGRILDGSKVIGSFVGEIEPDREEREVEVLILLKKLARTAGRRKKDCVKVLLRWRGGEVKTSVIDGENTPFRHRTMSREQALASPLLPEILRTASTIAREQPDINDFITSRA